MAGPQLSPDDASPRLNSSRTAAAKLGIRASLRNSLIAASSSLSRKTVRRLLRKRLAGVTRGRRFPDRRLAPTTTIALRCSAVVIRIERVHGLPAFRHVVAVLYPMTLRLSRRVSTTSWEFCTTARDLAAHPELTEVIIAGHSEGSMLATMAAPKAAPTAIASLAGPGRPLHVLLRDSRSMRSCSRKLFRQPGPPLTASSQRACDPNIYGQTVPVPRMTNNISSLPVLPLLTPITHRDPALPLK